MGIGEGADVCFRDGFEVGVTVASAAAEHWDVKLKEVKVPSLPSLVL